MNPIEYALIPIKGGVLQLGTQNGGRNLYVEYVISKLLQLALVSCILSACLSSQISLPARSPYIMSTDHAVDGFRCNAPPYCPMSFPMTS